MKTFEHPLGQDRSRWRAAEETNSMWQAIYHELRRWTKASRAAAAAYNRTEIIVETDQILIIRKSHSERGWCAECGREVDMVGVQEAGALTGRIQPFVARSATGQSSSTVPMLPGCGDSRGWHWSQAADGSPRVCLESVLKSK